jgi:hypothetical protein
MNPEDSEGMKQDNWRSKKRGVVLRTPADVRRVVQRITSEAFRQGKELESAGRLGTLLAVWLKAFEIEKLVDIEARLAALEKVQEIKP